MKPYLFAILASFIWGCVPLLEKIGLASASVWTGLVFRCFGVLIGISCLLAIKFSAIKQEIISGVSGWWYLVFGGLLASIVAQIAFYHALKTGEVSRVTPIAATYPLVTFVLGLIFFNETITFSKLVGVFLILLGIILLK